MASFCNSMVIGGPGGSSSMQIRTPDGKRLDTYRARGYGHTMDVRLDEDSMVLAACPRDPGKTMCVLMPREGSASSDCNEDGIVMLLEADAEMLMNGSVVSDGPGTINGVDPYAAADLMRAAQQGQDNVQLADEWREVLRGIADRKGVSVDKFRVVDV